MNQWHARAHRLAQEKKALEEDKNAMQQWFERTVKAENENNVTIGKLETQQELLRHELLKKERGLGLWKKKENEYQSQISQLRDRIDEMSGMMASRQRETEGNSFEKGQQKDGVKSLKREKMGDSNGGLVPAALSKTKRNHDRSNTDPTNCPFPAIRQQQGLKTLPHNTKLPSLVSAPRPPPEGASGEDGLPRRTTTSRPKTLIDIGSIPTSKLPPLIHSRKLPSPRTGNKTLLSDLAALASESPRERSDVRGTSTPTGASPPAVKAVMGEKWIDRQGGEIDIGNIALHIPPNSVSAPVLITITQTDHHEARQEQIRKAGLAPYMKPGLQVRLQPHGQRFLRPIYMQMKGAKVNSPGKLLVFHKEVDIHKDFDWTDVTEEVKPTVRKDDVVISIDRFSIIETMRLLVPVVSLAAGMAIGYNMSLLRTHALALVNDKKGPCEFHVFHREKDPCLQVLCKGQSPHNLNNNNLPNLQGMKYLGYQSSRFELCDGERLFFYFDQSPDLAASFVYNHEESTTTGQRFQIPLAKGKIRGAPVKANAYPERLLVKRRVAEQLDDVTLCEAYLHSKPQAAPRGGSGLDEPDGAPSTEYEEPWEEAIRSNRVALVKTIDVRDILSYLIQNKIISLDEQEEIKSYRTRRERVEALIDKLPSKGPKGFTVFVQSLSEDYEDLSRSLQKGHQIEAT